MVFPYQTCQHKCPKKIKVTLIPNLFSKNIFLELFVEFFGSKRNFLGEGSSS